MRDTTPTLRVVSTLAVKGAMGELGARFTGETGVRLDIDYGPTQAQISAIKDGARGDVVVLTHAGCEDLAAAGILERTVDIAISHVGLAVRPGAPRPDISTMTAFRQALLDAHSIARSRVGASGLFFGDLLERMGLAEALAGKVKIVNGFTGEAIVRGEAEMAVQQVSELMVVPGIDVIGRIPKEAGGSTLFSAALFADGKAKDHAARLIDLLASQAAKSVLAATGLEPR